LRTHDRERDQASLARSLLRSRGFTQPTPDTPPGTHT